MLRKVENMTPGLKARNGRRAARWLAAACLLLAVGAAPARAQRDSSAVVARVDGTAITARRFNTSYVQHLIQTGRNDTPEERYAHLDDLIDTFLLAAEARARGLDDDAYQAYAARQFARAVGQRFFTVAFLDSLADPTDAELREAFRRARSHVATRHLLFRTREDAQRARARLDAGEPFSRLAREAFATPDTLAGVLGEAGYWELDDAYAEAAFALPVGAVSAPVRSRYGWHLIRVESRVDDPLITESEYQYRRKGIRSQVRQRRLRLEGDRFVRQFMEGLDVRVDPDGIGALQTAVRAALAATEPPDGQQTTLDRGEVAAVRQALAPGTVLATYTLDGTRQTFTAEAYARWLPELPSAEIRSRPAASVGRALRNEALAAAGFARGLAADPGVVDEVAYVSARYLAGALRDSLRLDAPPEPSEAELRQGYEKLGFRRLARATADYVHVPFATRGEAEAAAGLLGRDTTGLARYPGYHYARQAAITGGDPLDGFVRQAPLGQPIVVGTGDGRWHVLRVARRDLAYTTFDEARPAVRAALAPLLPEFRLIARLRANATIWIDDALFRSLMAPFASP